MLLANPKSQGMDLHKKFSSKVITVCKGYKKKEKQNIHRSKIYQNRVERTTGSSLPDRVQTGRSKVLPEDTDHCQLSQSRS